MTWSANRSKAPAAAKAKAWHKRLIATATLDLWNVTVYDIPEDEVQSLVNFAPEGGNEIHLGLRWSGTRYGVIVRLTNLTVDELLMFRDAVNYAVEKALPLCSARDQEAREAEQSGDYSRSRSNRHRPRMVVKPGQELKHAPVIRSLHSDIPAGDQPTGPQPQDTGSNGGSVAQPQPTDSVVQDNGLPSDSNQNPRPVLWLGHLEGLHRPDSSED